MMEKDILATKIKELRNRKGYSQEYLSEAAQLSLRTVQRIENGESEARGDTLNRLATVLEVKIDELTASSLATHNSKNYLVAMNLSAGLLIFLQVPFLSFLAPLMLWFIKKDEFEDVRERGKQILNFQITWNIVIFFLSAWAIICKVNHWRTFPFAFLPRDFMNINAMVLLEASLIITLVNLLLIIINTILLVTNRNMKYWPAYRFFK